MARRKYMGSTYKDYIKTFKSEIVRVDDGDLKGYAALMRIEEVNRPFIVGETCLYHNGYSELHFLPDGEHWQFYAIYDEKGNIIEWYFDMTRQNAVDAAGNPYCDDLYLDAVLMPDGKILILDEDELKDALDTGKITGHDFDMAYETLCMLQEQNIINVSYMETLCSKLFLLFA